MSRSGPTLMAAFKAIALVLRSTQEIHLVKYQYCLRRDQRGVRMFYNNEL